MEIDFQNFTSNEFQNTVEEFNKLLSKAILGHVDQCWKNREPIVPPSMVDAVAYHRGFVLKLKDKQ